MPANTITRRPRVFCKVAEVLHSFHLPMFSCHRWSAHWVDSVLGAVHFFTRLSPAFLFRKCDRGFPIFITRRKHSPRRVPMNGTRCPPLPKRPPPRPWTQGPGASARKTHHLGCPRCKYPPKYFSFINPSSRSRNSSGNNFRFRNISRSKKRKNLAIQETPTSARFPFFRGGGVRIGSEFEEVLIGGLKIQLGNCCAPWDMNKMRFSPQCFYNMALRERKPNLQESV